MKHTPLPWGLLNNGRSTLWHVEGPDGAAVCSVPKARKADSEFIVRACNSHYRMLEALVEVERVFRKGPDAFPADEIRALEWVRKAIAKAKEKGEI